MATEIKCPACGQKFAMELAVSEEYKKELRDKMVSFTKTKEEEFQRKTEELAKKTIQLEASFEQRLIEERKQAQQQIEESMRRKISQDYENEVRMLRQENFDNEEKLKSSRLKELEFLKK